MTALANFNFSRGDIARTTHAARDRDRVVQDVLAGNLAFQDNGSAKLSDPERFHIVQARIFVKRQRHTLCQTALVVLTIQPHPLRGNGARVGFLVIWHFWRCWRWFRIYLSACWLFGSKDSL